MTTSTQPTPIHLNHHNHRHHDHIDGNTDDEDFLEGSGIIDDDNGETPPHPTPPAGWRTIPTTTTTITTNTQIITITTASTIGVGGVSSGRNLADTTQTTNNFFHLTTSSPDINNPTGTATGGDGGVGGNDAAGNGAVARVATGGYGNNFKSLAMISVILMITFKFSRCF